MDQAFGLFGLVFENLVFIFAFFVLLELVFCYALQAIADKQNLSASWMAWVPLLQLYPMVMVGSSSFQPFLVLMGAGIAAAILGAFLGPLGILIAVAWCAWALVYFVALFWNTAEKRGVSGWIGLLAFVPLVEPRRVSVHRPPRRARGSQPGGPDARLRVLRPARLPRIPQGAGDRTARTAVRSHGGRRGAG